MRRPVRASAARPSATLSTRWCPRARPLVLAPHRPGRGTTPPVPAHVTGGDLALSYPCQPALGTEPGQATKPVRAREEIGVSQLVFTRVGTGPPLVLLHALGLSRRTWDPVIPGLARQFGVIAVDLPGFGESPPLPAHTEPQPAALAAAVA